MTLTQSPAATNPAVTASRRALVPSWSLAVALACSLMVACTVGPTYREPPPVAIGGGWSLPVVAGSGSEDYAHWWSTLGDPMLEALVDEALAENLDRSEEHTSELQSLMRISYAVFCLKNKKQHNTTQNNTRTYSNIHLP